MAVWVGWLRSNGRGRMSNATDEMGSWRIGHSWSVDMGGCSVALIDSFDGRSASVMQTGDDMVVLYQLSLY